MQQIPAPKTHSDQLVVVGDLRGQLSDLFTIFQRFSSPGEESQMFLFNGNLVNHGTHFSTLIPTPNIN